MPAQTPQALNYQAVARTAAGQIISSQNISMHFSVLDGPANIDMPPSKSRLHVFNGDVNIDQTGSGIILKSPNGQCWRVTIDNAGNLLRTAITCP